MAWPIVEELFFAASLNLSYDRDPKSSLIQILIQLESHEGQIAADPEGKKIWIRTDGIWIRDRFTGQTE